MRWEVLLPFTLILTGAFAALSWRMVEEPILGHKNNVLAFVASATAWVSGRVPRFPHPAAPVSTEVLATAIVSDGAVSSTLASSDERRP